MGSESARSADWRISEPLFAEQIDPSLCQVGRRRHCQGAVKVARDSGCWAGVGLVLGPGVT